LELGAWRSAVPAGILQLEACRLKLDACVFQLAFLSSTWGFDRYVS